MSTTYIGTSTAGSREISDTWSDTMAKRLGGRSGHLDGRMSGNPLHWTARTEGSHGPPTRPGPRACSRAGWARSPVYYLFMIMGSLFGSVFNAFLYWLHHFYEYEFYIDLSSMLGWVLVSLLIIVWYLFRSRTQPVKPSNTFVFAMNLNELTIQRNMIFDDFHDP